MQGIHRQIHISPFVYNASRVPQQLRVPREVPTPIAHHKVCPLWSFIVGPSREIHTLDPQPNRHSMLVPRVCAPRVYG